MGALLPFSLAPYHCWPLALVCIALFADLLPQQTPKQALLRGWSFGTGLWATRIIHTSKRITQGTSLLLLRLKNYLELCTVPS